MGQGRKPTPEGLLLHEAASPTQPKPPTPAAGGRGGRVVGGASRFHGCFDPPRPACGGPSPLPDPRRPQKWSVKGSAGGSCPPPPPGRPHARGPPDVHCGGEGGRADQAPWRPPPPRKSTVPLTGPPHTPSGWPGPLRSGQSDAPEVFSWVWPSVTCFPSGLPPPQTSIFFGKSARGAPTRAWWRGVGDSGRDPHHWVRGPRGRKVEKERGCEAMHTDEGNQAKMGMATFVTAKCATVFEFRSHFSGCHFGRTCITLHQGIN